MAGLLDRFFGSPDQTRALGLLGGAMMAGNAPQGFLQANQFLAEAPEREAQRKYRDMQMRNLESEMEARKAKADQQKTLMEMAQRIAGARRQPAYQPGQLGSGTFGALPTAPGVNPMQPVQGASGIGAADLNELAAFRMLGGEDMLPYYQYANDPRKMEPGATYENRLTGKREYFPRLPEGMAPGANGQYGFVPGYESSVVRLESGKTAAAEAARAGQDLVKIIGPGGAEQWVTRAQAVQASTGGRPPAPQMPPAQQTPPAAAVKTPSYVGDSQVVLAAINEMKDPQAREEARRQWERQYGPLQASPSTAQAASAAGAKAGAEAAARVAPQAAEQINSSWLKTSYEPTLSTGANARDLLETVQVTRQAMQNLGGTGWSTQAKAAGAAILTGLGIAPKNAESFAANAELFQKTAMERLWTTLNEAKGPQTEGDADRASKTYASLRNTTKANEFILDFAEAKAQRDQIKARFYQEALPVAREKGDLSEVDRQWSKLSPSIFSMPSLKRWAGGIK